MLILSKLENLKSVAINVLAKLGETRIICISGTLGAGKTTLVKEIGRQLGIKEVITSPTFTILNTYQFSNNVFVHVDAYRTNNLDESMELINDYNEGNNIIVVEWWRNINQIVDFDNAIKVDISIIDENTRSYKINV